MDLHSRLLGYELVLILIVALVIASFVVREQSRRHVKRGNCPSTKPVTFIELWSSLWSQVWSQILHGNPTLTIFLTGVLTIFIGVHLINPTVETFGATTSYGSLNRTPFGETTWGVTLVVLGLGKIILLAYNGVERERAKVSTFYFAAALNSIMCVIWLNIAIGILVAGQGGFGHATYFLLSLLSLWSATRRIRVARGGT